MLPINHYTLSKRSLALALAVAMISPPCSGLLAAAQAQDPGAVAPAAPAPPSAPPAGTMIHIPTVPVPAGPIHTILLFPLANNLAASGANSGFNPEVVGARVEDAIKMRLNVIGYYKADSFSPNLPQIQRALSEPNANEAGLTENDLTPPYDDSQKAQKIASQIGTDGYLLGTIEALHVDAATRNVSITVSTTLYNTATGSASKVLAFTGKGTSFNASDDPDNILQSAINDAAGHIVSTLNAGAPVDTHALKPVDSVRGHHDNTPLLWVILGAAVVGIAIASSHHGGGGGGSSNSGSGNGNGNGGDTGLPPNPPGLGNGGNPSGPPSPPMP